MFARSLNTAARSFARRSISTGPSAPSSSRWSSRHAFVAGTTLAISALAISSERRKVLNESAKPEKPSPRETVLDQKSLKEPIHKTEVRQDGAPAPQASESSDSVEAAADGAAKVLEEKKEEAGDASQGAFNPETGEINWDCPCLGGMATGPCGEQFKAAFSCFVYSEAEPKGVDCVEKFKAMQDCFREHPEIYGEEIDDDEAPAAVSSEGSAASEEKKAEEEKAEDIKVAAAPAASP
ncbi:hypothetical protein L202_04487 [Cryptococcus amylolentus CBS 6039]|uniref:Mitochondrial intermembrane space import and assembly protein 40 n=1 Tax=Cryptococcus amylolentus CBS 6039 TaxID=1295533 RepID=A0A1E3HRL1_9TREE|nr:hypothetical protein L202_04487 [Cryptococcus amylolentus CBS 6039]ODN78974.1 hypothetical protein L202_04487 [Cryptococcus amylolentus CBS 6039]